MSNVYIFQNEKLKNSFKNIISMKREIGITKNRVSNKLGELKKLHTEMIKDNNKQIFLFCLDSFYYQYKIFAMEFEHVKKLRSILNNRMYCDYYKLHNIIVKFCKDHFNDDDINIQTFPVYKDLEPFQEYRIEDIELLHASILKLINNLYLEAQKKEDAIMHYNDNHKVGFSISNFLNTLTHDNRMLQEQISLYINYISFFHISQQKQLKKLHNRINEFFNEVDENINMNYTFSIDDIQDEQTLEMLADPIEIDNEPIQDIITGESTIKIADKLVEEPTDRVQHNSTPVTDHSDDTDDINIIETDISKIPAFKSIAAIGSSK